MDGGKDGARSITIRNGLPFVAVELTHNGKTLLPGDFLIDTGSAGTMIDAEYALELCLTPGKQEKIARITGVGGAEFVYLKVLEKIAVGSLIVTGLVVEVGAVTHGFGFGGILGMDFLSATNAIIDLRSMELRI
jgi:predicted aspartyl protease